MGLLSTILHTYTIYGTNWLYTALFHYAQLSDNEPKVKGSSASVACPGQTRSGSNSSVSSAAAASASTGATCAEAGGGAASNNDEQR